MKLQEQYVLTTFKYGDANKNIAAHPLHDESSKIIAGANAVRSQLQPDSKCLMNRIQAFPLKC